MSDERWNTKKIAAYGLLLGAAAMLIASAANGQMFNKPFIVTFNAIFITALLSAGLLGAISGIRNYHQFPNALTHKWNTGRIALIGSAIGVVISVLSTLQTSMGGTDIATNAGMLTAQIAAGLVWGGCIGAAFSAARNALVKHRLPRTEKTD